MARRKAHPACPFCASQETRALRNYGRQVGNNFQCLACKVWWCNTCKQRYAKCACQKEVK